MNLVAVLPPPASSSTQPTDADLAQFEDRLGVLLAPDHASLLTRYGAGWIDDFLWIPSVIKGGRGGDLETGIRDSPEELRGVLHRIEAVTLNVWPNPHALTFVGRSGNGDTVMWDPVDERVVVVEAKCSQIEIFHGSIITFLHGALTAALALDSFSEDAFDEVHTYRE